MHIPTIEKLIQLCPPERLEAAERRAGEDAIVTFQLLEVNGVMAAKLPLDLGRGRRELPAKERNLLLAAFLERFLNEDGSLDWPAIHTTADTAAL